MSDLTLTPLDDLIAEISARSQHVLMVCLRNEDGAGHNGADIILRWTGGKITAIGMAEYAKSQICAIGDEEVLPE